MIFAKSAVKRKKSMMWHAWLVALLLSLALVALSSYGLLQKHNVLITHPASW
jgi:hypothetical protein